MNELAITVTKVANGYILGLNQAADVPPNKDNIFVFDSTSSLAAWLDSKLSTVFAAPQ
jgi:hypothetical protein